MMANGHCTVEAFEAYLADGLSEVEARSVASHLRECEKCRNHVIAISEGLLWAESWVTQTRQQTELQRRLADALKREEARESLAKRKERIHWWRNHITLGVPSSGRASARPRYALQARGAVRTRGASPSPAPKAVPKWLEATSTPPRIFVPADADVIVALPEASGHAAMTALIPTVETGETRIAETVKGSSGAQWLAHFRAVPKGEYVVAAEPPRTGQTAEPRPRKS